MDFAVTGHDGARTPSVTGQDDRVTGFEIVGATDFDGLHIQRLQRLNKAEPGLLVYADDVRGNGPSLGVDKPHGLRLHNQVTDGQYQTILADEHTVTGPLGAKGGCGKRVPGYLGTKGKDAQERFLKVESKILGFRPLRCADVLAEWVSHGLSFWLRRHAPQRLSSITVANPPIPALFHHSPHAPTLAQLAGCDDAMKTSDRPSMPQ